jgi:hypothetical protein
MWLGLLFTMMCLATQFQQILGTEATGIHESFSSPQDHQNLVQFYREKIVQCLILGKYTKAAP